MWYTMPMMATTSPRRPAGGIAPAAALALCQALADSTRFALMASIWQGERCVCDLQTAAGGLPQNLVSHHLGVLRRMELVQARRAGRWMYYKPAETLDDPADAALHAL